MKVRAIIALLVVFVFAFGIVSMAVASEVKGTVTKIDGNKITVRDAARKEITVGVKEVPKGLRTGDMVAIKDGVVTVEKRRKVIEGC